MSMHMIRGVQVHGKSKKKLTPKDLKAQAEHEKWLKSIGVGKTKLPTDAKGKRVGINEIPDYSTGPRMTSDTVAGHGTAREQKRYSGERQLIGIATMHKSNMVPIFADRKEDAKEVASMRR